ncbi:MAG: hypothetical protein IJS67_00110 [Clostridia bacterium]|nr:hypothetical protein [Clostridia bacterium]
MKKFLTFVATATAICTLAACTRPATLTARENTAALLKTSLATYLSSDALDTEISTAASTQARLPLMYLKYVNGYSYSEEATEFLKTNLDLAGELLGGVGKIDDTLFDQKEAFNQKNDWGSYIKWQSTLDYCFSFSFMYNQYEQATGNSEAYDAYAEAITDYISALDETFDPYGYIGTSWGFQPFNEMIITAANLGGKKVTPNADAYLLSYYEKDGEGNYAKQTEQPNWNGFSGRPLAASLFTDNAAYDGLYEKTMQGYYPKSDLGDNWYPTVDLMVTVDEFYDYYEVSIGEWNTYDPQFVLLTAMAHGIDVFAYENAKSEKQNLLTAWLDSLDDGKGGYTINSTADMAVAIAFIATVNGVKNPSPIGKYSAKNGVINIEK